MKGSQLAVEVDPAREATSECPSWSPAYRCAGYVDADPPTTGFQTVHELWKKSYKTNKDHPCLGMRTGLDDQGSGGRFAFMNYQQIHLNVASLAGSILTKLLRSGKGEGENGDGKGSKGGKPGKMPKVPVKPHVGIFGANCPAWLITFFACARSRMVSVPLYETVGVDVIEYIIRHAELQMVFVDGEKMKKLANAIENLKGEHSLKYVVHWSGNYPKWHDVSVKLEAAGVRMIDFGDLIDMGMTARSEVHAPQPEDLCTIMYTSGSTGMPKGVMITHKAIMQNVASLSVFFEEHGLQVGFGDSFLSFLPLAHIFDLTFELFLIHAGGKIGYFRGNPKHILSDAQLLKPTVFIGVPRIFDKLCASAKIGLRSMSVSQRMMWGWCFNRKRAFLRAGVPVSKASPVFDLFCSSHVHNMLGGRQRVVISGGASLSAVSEEFLRVAMRCPVIQGYGLTETSAGALISVPDVPEQVGTVGPPLPSTCLRLESVPEMNYDALGEPPIGEILIKSVANFSGYYKDDDRTKEVVGDDGWFHTGDIGAFKDNSLTIVDRRKNIFKMSHGEYIAVEVIEMALKRSVVVDQIWVYGDGTKFDLVAVVVPSSEQLEGWAKLKDISGSFADLCRHPEAHEHILHHLTLQAKQAGLQRLEFVQAVHLDSTPFSPQNELLTPTFKHRRKELLQYYRSAVDELYSNLK